MKEELEQELAYLKKTLEINTIKVKRLDVLRDTDEHRNEYYERVGLNRGLIISINSLINILNK